MLIQHRQTGLNGIFFIGDEGDDFLAELLYTKKEPSTLVIEHTEVDKKLQGRNIGYELVHAAIGFARDQGFTVIPLCPFARVVMERKPELQDVLSK